MDTDEKKVTVQKRMKVQVMELKLRLTLKDGNIPY
jgi:hypothetical protein